MRAYALIIETFRRKASVCVIHVSWLLIGGLFFLIPFPPGGRWQWGGFLFAWSGCLLSLLLSAGIFGDDIASGRIRLLATKPMRPSEFYFYRLLGLSLQGTIHLVVAAGLILVLHRLTGRGSIKSFAAWIPASWLIFNAWAALSTSVSVMVNRERNSMLVALATIVVVIPLDLLILFFEDSIGTKICHEIVRYAGPPVEFLVQMGLGRYGLLDGLGHAVHCLILIVFYGVIGVILLDRREFTCVGD